MPTAESDEKLFRFPLDWASSEYIAAVPEGFPSPVCIKMLPPVDNIVEPLLMSIPPDFCFEEDAIILTVPPFLDFPRPSTTLPLLDLLTPPTYSKFPELPSPEFVAI